LWEEFLFPAPRKINNFSSFYEEVPFSDEAERTFPTLTIRTKKFEHMG